MSAPVPAPARGPGELWLGLTAHEREVADALFGELFGQLAAIGRDPEGSWTRLAWTPEAEEAARWFDTTAARLGLRASVDRNGNRWAWSAPPRTGSIVTGSHLDTVPHGGSFDGALGVVAGFVAVHLLMRRGRTDRPLAVVSFADEEGGRFNTPTFGSRLATGALDPRGVLARTDDSGVSLEDALRGAGVAPEGLGADPELLQRIGAFVELHIEQGQHLEKVGRPLALAMTIMPHGRWRVDLAGEGNHGGTTALAGRRDPMLAFAEVVLSGRRAAVEDHALVTVGKVEVRPNATNAIAERVTTWLDVRCADDDRLDQVVDRVTTAVRRAAAEHRLEVEVTCESRVGGVRFSDGLREHIAGTLAGLGLDPVPIETGAGHDAGALADHVPTAMLFVRNPTGVSHSPAESARSGDCATGIAALVAVLDGLANNRAPSRGAASLSSDVAR